MTRTKRLFLLTLAVPSLLLGACGGGSASETSTPTSSTPSTKYFVYEDASFVDKYGSRTNEEVHDYNGIKVNRVENELREDFALGVDASMTYVVEQNEGVYYNQDGKEQDIFQILRRSGVNFVRFRLWNNPESKLHKAYGGGNNDLSTDLELARRAKAANLNVMIDFHYSDFWADPDHQQAPRAWAALATDKIPAQIETFTKETLQAFKDANITVDAVQIGNEINNGMSGFSINWNNVESSFDTMANMLKAGIKGAKEVFPIVKSVLHLANGGNIAEFETFFMGMNNRNVAYDIIGASYYPHLSGSLEDLQSNLNNVTQKTGKPAMVVETSWGFSDDWNEYCQNTYSSADEEVGRYLTSEQAQATCVRDITNVLSKVPNQMGLGIFYWEPGWLPVRNACWATASGQSYQEVGDDSKRNAYEDGLATWSNQGLFSYTGKALSSLRVFDYLRNGYNEVEEVSLSARKDNISVTINLAADESLPTTARVVTNLDAIRDRECVWDESALEQVKHKGTFTNLNGKIENKYNIVAAAKCIQNFVVDPGFENQGTTDDIKAPWILDYSTPVGAKVAKLDRKSDIRSGKTDLNWYHSSEEFSFQVSQTISSLPAGTYSLTTYIMAIRPSEAKHNSLVLFLEVEGGANYELDLNSTDYLKGWSEGYQTCNISGIELEEGSAVKIGLRGSAAPKAWAHNDDWELVNNND